jgi:uncharacterized protein (TIGR02569 family)
MTVPGRDVLDAFGLTGDPVVLPGGEGRSIRVGDAVLKPADPDRETTDWLADIMASLPEDGFRVARPLRTADGAWSHSGWSASRHLAGTEPDHAVAPRWPEIIAAGRAFHRALAGVPRPGFLDRRSSWWATGDKVAWGEEEPDLLPGFRVPYDALASLLGPPPRDRSQLIHGDLTGNVLFAPGLAPAVIDFSPYWRPPAFGEAVVVGDALIRHAAGGDLLARPAHDRGPTFVRYVARAVVYRLVTTSERVRAQRTEDSEETLGELRRYERAAAVVGAARDCAQDSARDSA